MLTSIYTIFICIRAFKRVYCRDKRNPRIMNILRRRSAWWELQMCAACRVLVEAEVRVE